MLFTIFGATGDLTTKKLIPALYRLYEDEQIPIPFTIVCIGRRAFETDAFIEEIRGKIEGEYPHWDDFKQNVHYLTMDFSLEANFEAFKDYVDALKLSEGGQKIYYLATAPHYFPIIARALIVNQMIIRGDMRSKIVFEKPFGEDLETAKAYNRLLLESIEESQVYRIDHYLGKEMLQNILTVRFANKIFESIWNHENIESVKIIALESETVKQRGGYYDHSGALKDMVQNHLFQTLALVAMDSPMGLSDTLIKNQKVEVLECLQISDDIVFGQYDGYLQEKGIPGDSKTETFVAIKAYVNTQRWRNTPFYLMTGKKMAHKLAEIVITFKDASCFFEKGQPEKNTLTIEIFPREGIVLKFNGKAPGLQAYTMPMRLDYCHMCNIVGNSAEAYEKLILDVIHDDSSLFTRWDEIESSWKVIDSINRMKRFEPLYVYNSESEMMQVVEEKWRNA
ncbi:glucose-6-phosphate dehydrogenase [Fusibacter bizertensis]